ncbi:hypothetical protein [Streptomyces himalayensis]|uniref:hypothetical protein n=1 Tax=Streptomyces himalayensis TaxID=2820085 RepID=UPI00215DA2D1|nr:hypothetical protein [Streptomyces himalayensis]
MSLTAARSRTWSTEAGCDPDDFGTPVEQATDPRDRPSADCVQQNVLLYDSDRLRILAATAGSRHQVQAWVDAEAACHGPAYGATAVGVGSPLAGGPADGDDPARLRERARDHFKSLAERPR